MNGSIYKAVVVRVSAGDAYLKIHPQVFVTPLHSKASKTEIQVDFSSIIPTSASGSSFRTLPKVGQECLIAHVDRPTIIGYTSRTPLGGLFTPEDLSDGSSAFAGGTANRIVWKFDPLNGINMNVGLYTELDLDLLQQKITQKSKVYHFQTAGAYITSELTKKTDENTWREVFQAKPEKQMFSDRLETLESFAVTALAPFGSFTDPTKPPKPHEYVSKAVLTAGHVPGENVVYLLETRQAEATTPFQLKNIFTTFRAGKQLQHKREGIAWDGGSVLEWTGKHNLNGSVGTYLSRWGALLTGEQKGEVLRTQVYENMNFSKFGVPLKAGEGWKYNTEEDAELVYIDSIGILSDKTIKRRFLSQKFSKFDKKDVFKYKEEFLGTGAIYLEHVDYKDISFKTNILQDGSLNYVFSNTKGTKSIFNEFFGPDGHAKMEIKSPDYGALVNIQNGIKITYTQDKKDEVIELKSDNLKITLSSEVSLEIKGKSFILSVGKASLTLDESSFSLKVDKASLTISADGKLLYNEQPLAFAEIINILFKDGAPGIGISGAPGTPAPLHPAVLAKITAGMALPALDPGKKALFTNK